MFVKITVIEMVVFRKALKDDIAKIADIYSDIHTQEEAGLADIGWIRDVYPTYKTAEESLIRGDLFVAQYEDEVVGSAIINKNQVTEYKDGNWQYDVPDDEVMVLHTLTISPKTSGMGLGKQFVDFYEKYALENNCRYLRMDTNARNKRARAMYKKLGYTEIGQVKCDFNGISGIDLVLFEKAL